MVKEKDTKVLVQSFETKGRPYLMDALPLRLGSVTTTEGGTAISLSDADCARECRALPSEADLHAEQCIKH